MHRIVFIVMSGNVWEWCLDWYAPDYYSRSPKADPINRDYGEKRYRICRGGSWGLYPTHCRSANRGGGTPTGRFYSYGFRVVLAPSNRTSVSRRIRLYVPSA